MVKPIKTRPRRKQFGAAGPIRWIAAARAAFLVSCPYLLSLALAGTLLGSAVAFAVNSPAFALSEVRVLNAGTMTPEQAFRFCELKKGENLVAIDLIGVQEVIKRRHPEFKEVRVRRVLPNRVEVVVRRRTPVAQMAFSKYVQVDKDLVVLQGSSAAPFRNLTVIEGAPLPRTGLFVGMTLTDPHTKRALRLSEITKRSGILKNHTLTKVDIGDPRNVSLIVDGDIDIRIGGNHFIERLKILDQTLRTIELDRSKIRYIDLRFDDVVIGPA